MLIPEGRARDVHMPKGHIGVFLRLKVGCPRCRQIRDASVEAIVSDDGLKCLGCGKQITDPESEEWRAFTRELGACLDRLQPFYDVLP